MNERGMEDLRLQQAVHGPSSAAEAAAASRRSMPDSALAQGDLDATEVLRAFVDILELREPGAREHAERVSRLAVNLASVLRMAQADLSNIERAGLLHDLRRLGMPNRREISGHPVDVRQRIRMCWRSSPGCHRSPRLRGSQPRRTNHMRHSPSAAMPNRRFRDRPRS